MTKKTEFLRGTHLPVLMALMLLLAVACGETPDEADDLDLTEDETAEDAPADAESLRIGFVVAADALGGEMIDEMARHVEEQTDGALTVEVFADAALGGESEMLSQVLDGTLDMVAVGSGIVASVEPAFSITELPFLWESQEAQHEHLLDGEIGESLLAKLDEHGLKGLGFADWAPRDLFTVGTPVSTPDDLDGLRIRTIENPIHIGTWETLGANPTAIPFPELYTSLQQGVVDGDGNTAWSVLSASLYEVQDYMTILNYTHAVLVFVINQEVWDGLSPEFQRAIEEGIERGSELNRTVAAEVNEENQELLAEHLEILEPDVEPFRQVILEADLYERFADEIGPELIEEAQQLQGN